MTTAMDHARAVADAVLYEGYLLYPYRASAAKNRMRWQWGVLMPPAYSRSGTGEHSGSRTELLAVPVDGAVLHVRLRFLQLQARIVEEPFGEGHRPVPSVSVRGVEYTTWEEAVEREIDAVLPVADLVAGELAVPFRVNGGIDTESIPGGGGARLARRRWRLEGVLRLRVDALPGPLGGVRVRLLVENTSSWQGDPSRDSSRDPSRDSGREQALRRALIASHSLMSLSAGRFLSLTDPPQWASAAAGECRNECTWPVLVGEPERDDTVLSSPIILYDYPAIAAESAGDLFDGTEIDEILTLRTMTLTDEEKRQARATDERAAALIDRVDNLPPEQLEKLHGTVRHLRSATGSVGDGRAGPVGGGLAGLVGGGLAGSAVGDLAGLAGGEPASARSGVPWWDPGADASVSPETDSVVVDGVPVARGSRVRLRPRRRADAHDMFLAGRWAVVQAVLLDVDGGWHLAVTLEDDIGADLYAAHGRYRYFAPDEVEPETEPR
jgi:hypothetical protein